MGSKDKENIKESTKKNDAVSEKESVDEEKKEKLILDYKNKSKESKNEKLKSSEEKRESKWDKINWSKSYLEEKKETKWDKIDWSKPYSSKETKETKWDNIDWNKPYSEEKKIEGYKNDNINDNMMTGDEKYGENIKDLKDFKEDFEKKDVKEDFMEGSVDKLEDRTFQKDFIIDEEYENIENQKEWERAMEEFNIDELKISPSHILDLDPDEYMAQKEKEEKFDLRTLTSDRGYNDKLDDNNIDKDFIEEVNGDIEDKELDKDFKEDAEDESNQPEVKDIISEIQKDNKDDEIGEENYKNLLNEELQEKFKEYYEQTGKSANWGSNIRKDFINKIDDQINKEGITTAEKERLEQIKQICKEINENQEIQKFITDKIQNYNFTYKEISKETEKLGLRVTLANISRISQREFGKEYYKVNQGKWSFLDKDNNGNQLSYDGAVEKAADYLTKEILTEEFKEKYELGNKEAPSIYLDDNSMIGFRGAISYRNLSYNDIIEKAGLKANLELGKWSFLDKDNNGNHLSYDKAVEKAADYLTKEILTEEIKEKYKLGKGEAPTTDLKDEKFTKFISAIGNRALAYNDIIEKVGLKANLELGKWSFLDKDNNGNLLSYNKAVEKAADYLTKEILTEEFKEKYELGKGEAPTIDMENKELKKFRGAIGNRALAYNDIIEKVGLKANLELGKWSFLDKDNNGNQLSYDKAVEKAADYLTKEILTEEFKEKYELGKGEAPTMNLDEKNLNQFFSAIAKRNLSYNDILMDAGYKPHESTMFNEVGNNMHVILERIFLQHTREKGCTTFYEPYTNIDAKDLYKNYRLTHSDNCGIIDANFKNLSNKLEEFSQVHKDIKIINVDYFLGNSEKPIRNHCLRGYQGKEKMLICMAAYANEPQSPPTDIPYKKNVKILDPTSFSNFMGYEGEIKDIFIETIKLAKESTWKDNNSREMLERLANQSKDIIKEKYNYGQKEFKEYINNQKPNVSKDILKYKSDKSNIDYYF